MTKTMLDVKSSEIGHVSNAEPIESPEKEVLYPTDTKTHSVLDGHKEEYVYGNDTNSSN